MLLFLITKFIIHKLETKEEVIAFVDEKNVDYNSRDLHFMSLKKNIHILLLFILLALTTAASLPLFHNELFSAHDIWHQVARLYHYNEVVMAGQFPPRWVAALANGYGYPLFIFSYHLPWLFALPMTLSGISIFTAMRMLFVFGLFASAVSMYILQLRITKKPWASFVGSSIYVWAPYHFLSVYVAAAIGTVFLFALLPLLFVGIDLVLKRSYKWGTLVIASAISGSILTHLMTLAMILPFAVVFFITQMIRTKTKITKSGIALSGITLGLLISSFYLIPLIKYLPEIAASSESGGLSDNFQRYFPSLRQLVYSGWGYGPIISNAKDGDISMQIGIAQWLAFGTMISLVLISKIKKLKNLVSKQYTKVALGYGLLFILSIFFILDISLPFWKFAVKFVTLDFPFRLLIISVFSGSVLASLAIATLKNRHLKIILGVSLVLIALYTNRNHRKVNMYTQYSLEDYVGAETTTNTYHEYLPLTASGELLKDNSEQAVIRDNHLMVKQEMLEDGVLSLHQFAFPGIEAKVNEKTIDTAIDEKGRIKIQLAKGTHDIQVGFQKNSLIRFSEFLSLVGLAIIFILILQPKKRKK